jgi:mono/diheme cytochrome c family protein
MNPCFCVRWRAVWTADVTMLIALLSLGAVRGTLASGQAPTTTVLDGVYTVAQANRGQLLYAEHCGICHGDMLTGSTTAPSLTGDDFLAPFGGMTVGKLFTKVLNAMPSDDPGTLMPAQVADLLAYVFSQNKWPAGQKDLVTDVATLKQIRVPTK